MTRTLSTLGLGAATALAGAGIVALVASRPAASPPEDRQSTAARARSQPVPTPLPRKTALCLGIPEPSDLTSAWRRVWTATGEDADFTAEAFAVERGPWLLVIRHREAQAGVGQMTGYLYHADGPYACPLGDLLGNVTRVIRIEEPGRFQVKGTTRLTERWEMAAYVPRR